MRLPRETATREQAAEVLDYDPETGVFTWKVFRGNTARSGSVAGKVCKDGYLRFRLFGFTYLAHRVAWLMHAGEWPPIYIDHIDGNRANNRISNLRCADESENRQNSRIDKLPGSGFHGVYFDKRSKKWQVLVAANRRRYWLGQYADIEEAKRVRMEAKRMLHPTFGIDQKGVQTW